MKKPILIAAIFIAMALLFFGVDRVSAQATWESYSNAGHTTTSDVFTEPNSTVYMYGTGFTKDAFYKIVYWDGAGYKRVSEVQQAITGAGKLESQHTFGPSDVPGNWHVTVYSPETYDPASYDAGDMNIVADDTTYTGGYAFHVAGSAIPEFATVLAAIAVAGLCFGIYYWMRRRYVRFKVQN